jgi:SAM-dependent methyltransferase
VHLAGAQAVTTEHADRNRVAWNSFAGQYAERAPRQWAQEEIDWGIWRVPESEVRVLEDVPLAGADVVELGCGTGYVSAWLMRRGARPTGVDLSERQLETARRMQSEFGLEFPLVHASAEAVPLPDAAFDLAISEYGACLWCDPYLWIPEAARLLRPGGRLIFLTNSVLAALCMPEEGQLGPQLLEDYFGLHARTWADDGSTEFHLGWGDWLRLLRANGFELEDYVELRAPEGRGTDYEWASVEWGRRWPTEEIWKARKR